MLLLCGHLAERRRHLAQENGRQLSFQHELLLNFAPETNLDEDVDEHEAVKAHVERQLRFDTE